jgi:primosomal protein N' (replication factor Y)
VVSCCASAFLIFFTTFVASIKKESFMTGQNTDKFVEVVLPLHLPATVTYRVPREYAEIVVAGQRVAVQFGGKRIYSAIVAEVHSRIPKLKSVKYILSIIDAEPIA